MDVHIDIESYSELDLTKVGTYRYAEHESTEILMLAYQIEDGPITWHDLHDAVALPGDVLAVLHDPRYTLWAFNAQFERVMINEVCGLDIPRERWRCTMALANNLSFSGRLGSIVEQIGLGEEYQKDRRGAQLIMKFCRPQPASRKRRRWRAEDAPEDWQAFKEYNIQDVVAEAAVHNALKAFPQPDWADYWLDQKINDYGLAIDRKLVSRALTCDARNKARDLAVMQRITRADNPNSIPQLRDWMLEKHAIEARSLTKDAVVKLLEDDTLPTEVRAVLTLRQGLAKTSVSKYEAVDRAICEDGVLRGTLQYLGAARTHRSAGRILQPQNLPRPNGDQEEAVNAVLAGKATADQLSTAIRGVIVGYGGARLGVSDLAGIEGRVLPWLCYDSDKLARIYAGEDMYKHAAVSAFNVPYDSVDSFQRSVGKVIELACGYQGSVGAFQTMAKGYGVTLPDHQVRNLVQAWRKDNEKIVDFWSDVDLAVRKAIRREGETFLAGRLKFTVHAGFLWMKLPSGNYLAYYHPRVEDAGLKENIYVMGVHQGSRKWKELPFYGGKFVENATQAVAGDILKVWLRRLDDAGFLTVLHVHDEVVFEVRSDTTFEEGELEDCMDLIRQKIGWAKGLRLDAEGFLCDRYRK